ncbi:MAG: hypothetical protein ACREP9_15765, partial [Candidatus Dormibacteraceae bacterium]
RLDWAKISNQEKMFTRKHLVGALASLTVIAGAVGVIGWVSTSWTDMARYASAEDAQVSAITAQKASDPNSVVDVTGVDSVHAGLLSYPLNEEPTESPTCWINKDEAAYYGVHAISVTRGPRPATCIP